MKRIIIPCLVAATLAPTFANTAFGATIDLANGSKIEGKILSRDDTALHVDSAQFGRIDIPLSNVAKIEGDEAVNVAPPPPPPPAPPKSTMDRFLESIYPLDGWKTDISFGAGFVSGQKDSRNFSATFGTERKWKTQELRFDLIDQYESSTDSLGEDEVTKDMFKATARYRVNLSERLFVQSESMYAYDNVKNIDRDLRESIGLGWRVIKADHISLTLTPSMTAELQTVAGDDQDVIYSPTMIEEFTLDFSKSVSLRESYMVLFPVNGDGDPSHHFSLELKNKLSEHLALNVLYLYDYDGSLPADIEPSQQSLNFMLGLSY